MSPGMTPHAPTRFLHEEWFRRIFETSTIGIVLADFDGHIEHCNEAFAELAGYSEDELRGMSFFGLLHPSDREATGAAVARLRLGEVASFEVENRHVRKDGAIVWTHKFGSVIRDQDGHADHLLAIATDISDRKRVEGALRESEARFRAMSDGLPLLVWLYDAEGGRQFVNQTFCDYFGTTREDVLSGRWQITVDPGTGDAFSEAFFAAVRDQRPFHGEARVLRGDGEWRWIEASGTPRVTPEGRYLGIAGTTADVTERKLAETEVLDSRARLREMADAMPQLVWTSDANGIVDYYNERWHEYEGIAQRPDGAWDWQPIIHPDDLPDTLARWKHARTTGESFEKEHRIAMRGKGYRWHVTRAVPRHDADGRLVRWYGTATDIHSLKLAETELTESRGRLRQLADAMPQLVWTANAAGIVDYYNERRHEYEGIVEHADGTWEWQPIIHPDDIAATLENWARARETGTPFEQEHRIAMRGGEYRWHISRAVPGHDASGNLVRWFGTATDIHSQKLAEFEISENRARLRELADAMPQLVWTSSNTGVIDYCNARATEYEGLTRRADGTWDWGGVVHPEDAEATAIAWRLSSATGVPFDRQIRLRKRDGGYRWHVSRAVPRRDANGDVVQWYGTATDIHAQKLAEEAIAESSKSLREMAEAMPQLVWTARPDGVVDYYSGRVREYPGISQKPDGSWEWAPVVHPDDAQATVDAWNHAWQTGEPYEIEHRIAAPDGVFRWHVSRATCSHDAEGNILRWYGTATDIHDLKMTEAALRANEAELQAALSLKDEFLGMVSHEMRTPLTNIVGMSRVIANGIARGDDIIEAADLLYEHSKRLQNLVENMLLLARLDTRDVLASVEPVHLGHLVKRAVEEHRLEYPARPLTFEQRGNDVLVEGQPTWLAQVLDNLISNAEKYCPPEAPVRVLLESRRDEVIVRVIDNGPGLDPELAPRIFDPFVRDPRTATTVRGIGLGLPVCKRLVELLGGRIWTCPVEPTGTEFSFALPALRVE